MKLPAYRDLEWRLDMQVGTAAVLGPGHGRTVRNKRPAAAPRPAPQVASRALRQQAEPKVVLRLETHDTGASTLVCRWPASFFCLVC
jgi:hypothetical protein